MFFIRTKFLTTNIHNFIDNHFTWTYDMFTLTHIDSSPFDTRSGVH